ncbi:hypothetical protein ATI61_108119 [Archangium gephyra]|uniref:Uncharacterized protein n=1 Tax=Archangium gephyra TaxID=48 RepID=A0AAC8Q7J9_9BACT|nr:hypothetical protein [Archangium gephyra]AKJ02493.1 Hypothetical protein AA314_04119 [Archangium gephyra]REG28586.1 hypothetical protein ATI61_108119 [Archangium gephyra]
MGIKLGGASNLFKGGGNKVPDFKPSAPKPDVKPQFTPRPDINGNKPGLNGPGFHRDSFESSRLNNPKLNGLGNMLGGVGDAFGGVAQGAAGLAGAGLNAASTLGMMAPQMMAPAMDPYAAAGLDQGFGGAPMMDPYAAAGGLPPELAGAPMRDPFPAGGMPPGVGGNQAPTAAAPLAEDGTPIPQATDKRPRGDTRSAADIVNESPALARLGRQKDIKFNELCKQTGVDPKLGLKDSRQNPDAVYRLAKVLEYIDSSKISDGGERTGKVQGGKGDGNIEGITKHGDARHGTEAGMVKDFAEKGYASLGSAHRLPTTSDTHVKKDGSNKDNFQWFAGEAGKHLWFLPGVSNVLTGIGNSEGGVKGVIEGGLGGMVKTWKGAAEGVIGALGTGKVNPASALLGAYTGALGETEAAPQKVKDLVNMLPV